jgi:anti-sigma factor RsiW
MESPKTEDQRLQMLFDGELAPEEEAAIRRSLESSPAAMAQLHQWEQLREAMKSVSTGWAGRIDSDALFARIETDIGIPVIPIDQSKRERPPLRLVPGTRERRVWGAVATGFAAAAAIFLAVLAWPKSDRNPSVAGTTMPRGSEVLEVDFGSNTGTIDDEQVGLP